MSNLLSVDQLTQEHKPEITRIDLESLGGHVFVRKETALDRVWSKDVIAAKFQSARKEERELTSSELFEIRVVSMVQFGICDEEGTRLLRSYEDAEAFINRRDLLDSEVKEILDGIGNASDVFKISEDESGN